MIPAIVGVDRTDRLPVEVVREQTCLSIDLLARLCVLGGLAVNPPPEATVRPR